MYNAGIWRKLLADGENSQLEQRYAFKSRWNKFDHKIDVLLKLGTFSS